MGARGESRRARARRVRAAEDRALKLLRLLLGFALALCAPAALAQNAQEHEVKAAFLFKFPTFVEWPSEAFPRADAPFVIGVYGAEDIAGELRQIVQGRTLHNRPVSVRRLQGADSLAGVHMVFLGRAEGARLPAAVRAASLQPLLVVTDWEGALEQGGMINFVPGNGRVRFEVALDAAERSRLRISSRMLSVAHRVVPPR